MPDWKPEIRRRLANSRLEPMREAVIVEKLAQYLDDHYAELLVGGASEAEAYQQTLLELCGSELLAHELRRVERPNKPKPVEFGTKPRLSVLSIKSWPIATSRTKTPLVNAWFGCLTRTLHGRSSAYIRVSDTTGWRNRRARESLSLMRSAPWDSPSRWRCALQAIRLR